MGLERCKKRRVNHALPRIVGSQIGDELFIEGGGRSCACVQHVEWLVLHRRKLVKDVSQFQAVISQLRPESKCTFRFHEAEVGNIVEETKHIGFNVEHIAPIWFWAASSSSQAGTRSTLSTPTFSSRPNGTKVGRLPRVIGSDQRLMTCEL